MARFVMITLSDGTLCDGILLSPAPDTGEGASTPLVQVLGRGGIGQVVEAVQGADAGSFFEAQ